MKLSACSERKDLVAEYPGPKKLNLAILVGLNIYPKTLKVTYSA